MPEFRSGHGLGSELPLGSGIRECGEGDIWLLGFGLGSSYKTAALQPIGKHIFKKKASEIWKKVFLLPGI